MADHLARLGGHWGRIAFVDLASMSGFDSDGWPTEAKLAELELNWLWSSR